MFCFFICSFTNLSLLVNLVLPYHTKSILNDHRLNLNFSNCINPPCAWSLEIESTNLFFLHCSFYNSPRVFRLNDFTFTDKTLSELSNWSLAIAILYCGPRFDDYQNAFILNSCMKYIVNSEIFSGPLFQKKLR